MIKLLHLPTIVSGLLLIVFVVIPSMTGLFIVRRKVEQEKLSSSNEIIECIYQMVGVLYAVLLAFIVVVVWGQFTEADRHTQLESGAVADLFRDANAFAPATRTELQEHLLTYTRDVIDNEWPTMAVGDSIELESEAFKSLWRGYLAIEPVTTKEIAFHNESIKRLNELGNTRRLRIIMAEAELPSILWVLLIGGSVISILFTYLVGTTNGKVHEAAVGMLSALLGFVLFLIFSLEHPYIGRVSVSSSPFEHVFELATHGLLAHPGEDVGGPELARLTGGESTQDGVSLAPPGSSSGGSQTNR